MGLVLSQSTKRQRLKVLLVNMIIQGVGIRLGATSVSGLRYPRDRDMFLRIYWY